MLGKLTQTTSSGSDNCQQEAFNPFRLGDLVKTGHGERTDRMFAATAEHALGLSALARDYEQIDKGETPFEFASNALKHLQVSHEIVGGSLDNIPQEGACIVVANHPFGGIEGIFAAHLLHQRRDDVKVMANGMLKRVPEFSDLFIGVNPYADENAARDNFKPMREAISWLKQGKLLVVFPAGDVSELNLRKMRIADGPWDSLAPRLARCANADIVPIYFGGRNSLRFHLAAKLHPRLKTAMLPRELSNKRHAELQLWIGEAISAARLRGLGSDEEIAKYLRLCTLMLRDMEASSRCPGLLQAVAPNAADNDAAVSKGVASADKTPELWPVRAAVEPARLVHEIEQLPEERQLASSGDLAVYYANSHEIPSLLQEIGRLREITFRAVGEGTGKPVDIDLYDNYYLQLFIWDRARHKIAGAYRLGLSDHILPRYGKRGFYSHSLFKYRSALIRALGPSIEMGRSFVTEDYQRSFAPLMLLWKGIGMFVVQNPRYATLFGPVSISNEYNGLSQQLLIDFLKANNFDAGLGKRVRARRPYRPHKPLAFKLKPVWRKTDLADMQSIQGISELVSLIEGDDKGAPVLIKQYLKMGGRMLGFNVDQQFSDCIDGLMLADLRQADPKVLKRYMGAEGTESFLAYHASGDSTAAPRKALR